MNGFENLSCFIFRHTVNNSQISINREGKGITTPENISRGKCFMVEETNQLRMESMSKRVGRKTDFLVH